MTQASVLPIEPLPADSKEFLKAVAMGIATVLAGDETGTVKIMCHRPRRSGETPDMFFQKVVVLIQQRDKSLLLAPASGNWFVAEHMYDKNYRVSDELEAGGSKPSKVLVAFTRAEIIKATLEFFSRTRTILENRLGFEDIWRRILENEGKS